MKAKTEELAQISLFKTLNQAALDSLQPHTQIQTYQQDEIIIHEGDLFPQKLHTVLRGKLLAQKVSPAGKETILRQLPAREMFAAPALFGDSSENKVR